MSFYLINYYYFHSTLFRGTIEGESWIPKCKQEIWALVFHVLPVGIENYDLSWSQSIYVYGNKSKFQAHSNSYFPRAWEE